MAKKSFDLEKIIASGDEEALEEYLDSRECLILDNGAAYDEIIDEICKRLPKKTLSAKFDWDESTVEFTIKGKSLGATFGDMDHDYYAFLWMLRDLIRPEHDIQVFRTSVCSDTMGFLLKEKAWWDKMTKGHPKEMRRALVSFEKAKVHVAKHLVAKPGGAKARKPIAKAKKLAPSKAPRSGKKRSFPAELGESREDLEMQVWYGETSAKESEKSALAILKGAPDLEGYREAAKALRWAGIYRIDKAVASMLRGAGEKAWASIRKACIYRHIGLRLERETLPEGPNWSPDETLCAAMLMRLCDLKEFCGWTMTLAKEVPRGRNADFVKHILPFAYALYLIDRGRNREASAHTRKAQMGPYKAVLENWDDEAGLKDALRVICDYHFDRRDSQVLLGRPDVFPTPFNVFPVEVYYLRRIRADLDLPTPEIDHVMMQFRFPDPPPPPEEETDPVLADLVSRYAHIELGFRSKNPKWRQLPPIVP